MNAPDKTIAGLVQLASIKTTGDLRRVVAESMLALTRGQIGREDVDRLAKGLQAINESLNAEVKVMRMKIEMHRKGGGELGELTHLGNLLIGGDDIRPDD